MAGEEAAPDYRWSLAVPFIMFGRTLRRLDRVYALYVCCLISLLLFWVWIFLFPLKPYVAYHYSYVVVSLCYFFTRLSYISLFLHIPLFFLFAIRFLTGNSPEKRRSLFYYLLAWLGPMFILVLAASFSSHLRHRENSSPLGFLEVLFYLSLFYSYDISAFAVGQYLKNLVDYSRKGYPAPRCKAAGNPGGQQKA